MRARVFALSVVLMLPASLHAQRIHIRLPWVGRRPGPAPLPPQAPVIAREMRYRASRLSSESYSLFTFNQTDRYVSDRGASIASTQGFGEHVDWRFKPTFSLTGDFTSSLFGAPYIQNTFDFGGRFRPLRGPDYKIRPYVDLRASMAWSYASFAQPFDPSSPIAGPTIAGGRTTSHGVGALFGAGFETSLTRSFSLATGLGLSRYRMYAVQVGQQQLGSSWNYRTTAVRMTLGVKYNPGRMVPIP
jgi:hypothetical protein